MERAVHAFEVAGIVIGLVTGLHPLVITCVKHLVHDELGAALTDAFKQIMSPAEARTAADQSFIPGRFELASSTTATSSAAVADPGPVAGGETSAHRGLGPRDEASPRVTETATASPRSSTGQTAVNHEPAAPQRPALPTIASTGDRKITGMMNREGAEKLSPDGEKLLRAAAAIGFGEQDGTSMMDRANSPALSPGELLRRLTGIYDQPDDPGMATSPIEAVSNLNALDGPTAING